MDSRLGASGFLRIGREAAREPGWAVLSESRVVEAAQFARMQPCLAAFAQGAQGFDANREMLADALAVERVGHAAQLDFAVQRLVRDAQQRSVGNAEAEPV